MSVTQNWKKKQNNNNNNKNKKQNKIKKILKLHAAPTDFLRNRNRKKENGLKMVKIKPIEYKEINYTQL